MADDLAQQSFGIADQGHARVEDRDVDLRIGLLRAQGAEHLRRVAGREVVHAHVRIRFQERLDDCLLVLVLENAGIGHQRDLTGHVLVLSLRNARRRGDEGCDRRRSGDPGKLSHGCPFHGRSKRIEQSPSQRAWPSDPQASTTLPGAGAREIDAGAIRGMIFANRQRVPAA